MFKITKEFSFYVIALNVLIIVQVVWWIIFFFGILREYQNILEVKEAILLSYLNHKEIEIPDFVYFDEGEKIYKIKSEHELANQIRFKGYRNMLLWEGGFFAFVLILISFVMIKSYLKEKKTLEEKLLFLNSFTHDLKTPLAAVKLNLQTMKKKFEDPLFSELLSSSLEQLERLNQRISMILLNKEMNYLKENGIYKIQFLSILQEVLSDLEKIIIEKDARITLQNTSNQQELHLKISPQWFYFILKELITNSLKYSHRGVQIEISFQFIKAWWRKKFVIKIKDDGWGINEKKGFLLFEPYQRFHDVQTQTQTIEGTGLGLYYIKEILSKTKGNITWKRLNQGSEFQIEFSYYYE
ncbi:MAG: HAMP domain-containing histidine kinase [Leptospiraceae bacterium]|nr:HAMP domain-containing histidine kinase [Leptospiraceae bacterium]MDW7975569.1 HAMP domain-containing sensor histidine kinase [Leptospiraceae bacterium]